MAGPIPRAQAAEAGSAGAAPPAAAELMELPNIGPALSARLIRAGVTSPAELAALGPVAATLAIHHPADPACYNTLYALAGALAGVRWHDLAQATRKQLHDQFKAAL